MSVLHRVTSLIRNSTPPYGQHRALGTVLLKGPRGTLFFTSEVPLHYIPQHPPECRDWDHA